MNIRVSVQRALRDGTLSGASPIIDTPGVGAYLEDRLRRAFAPRGGHRGNAAFTVGAFWNAARTKSTARLLRMLQRALQNERGNQCVSDGTLARQAQRTYHVADINTFGYQACVALLDERRARGGVAYGALHSPTPREPAKDVDDWGAAAALLIPLARGAPAGTFRVPTSMGAAMAGPLPGYRK